MGVLEMSIAEMIYLVKKALQMMLDAGQDNGNIVIEIRRGEPRHVRFDVEVKATMRENEL
jgi:uncharacterized protein YqgV (UPF0045/DUF77 family)